MQKEQRIMSAVFHKVGFELFKEKHYKQDDNVQE
jgi:hypothetical protein